MYKLIIDDSNKGIAIMSDDFGNFTAYVNGKHYSVKSFRPLNGDGRQLREDSQKVIRDLLPNARMIYGEIEAKEAEAKAARMAEAMEAARAEATPKPRSFAEVLEQSFIQTLTEKSAADMVSAMYPTVEKMLVEKFGLIPQIHEIRIPNRPEIQTKQVLHKQFDRILSATLDHESLYFFGPAGTGKSFLARQLAEAIGVEYYYTNNVTDDVQIKGFIDAQGRYHETEFYKAFVNGGVFLLDELDASIPETLTMLNEALANGYFAFPVGKVTAHKDFYCVAAGNTFGTGADNEYTGRFQLDAATLNRFGVVRVDYDERIENAMCNNDSDLVAFAHDYRKAVKACGVSSLCTYRDIKRLYKFSAYMEKPEAIQIGLTKGLPCDDVRMIFNKLESKGNPWAMALEAVSKL